MSCLWDVFESWDLMMSWKKDSGGGGVQKSHCLVCRSLCKLHTHTHTLTNAQASLTKTSKQTWGPGQTSAPSQTPCICHTWRLAWPRPWRLLCLFHRVTHTEDVVGQHHHLAGPISLAANAHCSARRPNQFLPRALLASWVFAFFLLPAYYLIAHRPSPEALGFKLVTQSVSCPRPLAPCCPPELPSLITRHHHRQLLKVHGLLNCYLHSSCGCG